MANPHQIGSDHPLHRSRQLGGPPHTPISPAQSGFMPQGYPAHHQGTPSFSYESGGDHSAGQSIGAHHQGGPQHQPLHGYSPLVQPLEPRRPHLTVSVPHDGAAPPFSFDFGQSTSTPQHDQLPHNYYGNGGSGYDGGAGSSNLSPEAAFGSFQSTPVDGHNVYLSVPPQEWTSTHPGSSGSGRTAGGSNSGSKSGSGKRSGGGSTSPAKVPRHQFTACGACRHRRVKCDLRARQEEVERAAQLDDGGSGTAASRRRKVSCTNCQERGTNCVDEYAPLKAAKQLRRGKRISEIEMLYGKSATDAALASQGDEGDHPHSPTGRKFERIPELTREFFESAFFRRFHIARPIMDTLEFVTRYLSNPIPCSAAMGREGAVLCHCLYAWAVSYGVDERGQLDTSERDHLEPISLLAPADSEAKQQAERQRRLEKTFRIVRTILREIDEYGILRKPSWDGVRALLLLLPLTEGLSTSVERQAMYQAALSQVYMLCSVQGLGYDGLPAAIPESSMKDDQERRHFVRTRIYWYAFVHEALLSGLRGNTLLLRDDEDLSLLKESLEKQPNVNTPGHYHLSYKQAASPIHLAHACRLINTCLTSAEARRRDAINSEKVHVAWEMLDKTWDEFEAIKLEATSDHYHRQEEAVHFADSWKMVVFEALIVSRRALEDRLELLGVAASGGSLPRSRSVSPVTTTDIPGEIERVKTLLTVARSKCDLRIRQIVDIVRRHIGTSFFEWDASHVRDGVYWASVLLAREGGSDEDISICLQALNESRWAFSKGQERSQDLRQSRLNMRHAHTSPHQTPMTSGSMSTIPSESPFTSPKFASRTDHSHSMPHGSSSWPNTTNLPSAARFSPTSGAEGIIPQAGQFSHYQHELPPKAPSMSPVDHSSHHGHIAGQLPPGGVVYPPGQFVLQPDGSQVFVPYSSMP